jgi:hypothetical protein
MLNCRYGFAETYFFNDGSKNKIMPFRGACKSDVHNENCLTSIIAVIVAMRLIDTNKENMN